jgi:hypothetical protein
LNDELIRVYSETKEKQKWKVRLRVGSRSIYVREK